jgi:hypothetical protein
MMVGAVTYHGVDLAERYRCIYSGSDKETSPRRLSQSNLAQLRTDLVGRVLSAVHFEVDRDVDAESRSLDLWVAAPSHLGRKPACPFNVTLVAPTGAVADEDFVASCKSIWRLVESPYGLIYPGVDYADVYMELTSIPSRMLGAELSPQEELRLKWLGFWQRYKDEIGRLVRTAYWGNLLGSHFVHRLGGLEAIIESAPAALVEPLPGGGVYIQVSLDLRAGPEYERARMRLAEYLEPVTIGAHHRDVAPGAVA